MDKKLTVICVLWEGNFRTRNYTFNWVAKLKRMVARNLTIPHEFVCLTNTKSTLPDIIGLHVLPLINEWSGWWSKIEIFRPGLFEGRVLYLDLDMLIIDNIDEFASQKSPFILLDAWGKGTKKTEDGLSIYKYNSSVMSFEANSEKPTVLYNCFSGQRQGGASTKRLPSNNMRNFRGDQDFIASIYTNLDKFPNGMVVKLKDCPEGRLHDTAKIVLCMPLKNDKAAHKYKWVGEVWNRA